MEALLLSVAQKTATVQTIQVPVPASHEILVEVHAVALNPVDAIYTAKPLGQDGRVVGCDFAGIVTGMGSMVPADIQLQQRVAGFLQGACSVNERPGAFAQYLVVPWDLVWKVPESMDLKDAATVSLCGLTAAQILFFRLGLEAPFGLEKFTATNSELPGTSRVESGTHVNKQLKIIIYGSSSSLALYVAQLVHRSSKASGIQVLLYGVASRSQHEMLTKSPYSYTSLVDYHDSDWLTQIRHLAGGNVFDLAIDCISEASSVAQVGSLLTASGKLAVVRSRVAKAWNLEEGVLPTEPIYGAVWEGLGELVEYQGFTIPASSEARAFSQKFYDYLSKEPLVPNPVRLMPGGLQNIVKDGFTLLGSGTMDARGKSRTEDWLRPIRGEKLVYSVSS